MKTRKFDGSLERRVVTGMIVSTPALAAIAGKWTTELFSAKWSNLIGSWCVNYHRKYGTAPKKVIVDLFARWAAKTKDQDTATVVERYLETLSDEYETLDRELNVGYLIDEAGELFNRVRLTRLADTIQELVERGDVAKAEEMVSTDSRVELGSGAWVDPFLQPEVWEEAFREYNEPLLTFPGALGLFFGGSLGRDGFVAFVSPDKRGKSYWLMELAYQSLINRRRTAFFEVGDMSRDQVLRRLACRVVRRPLKPGEVNYPVKITRESGVEFAEVVRETKKYKQAVEWRSAWKACREVMERRVRSRRNYFHLYSYPNGTISAAGIESELDDLARSGWVADTVVIDYADLLDPLPGAKDPRERINETWKRLRRISQKFHCLLVTATQSDADGYSRVTLGQHNFSDDKRKNAHVTGMVGINQTSEEKINGIYRLNWIVRREEAYTPGACVHVASCLELANPAVRSTF